MAAISRRLSGIPEVTFISKIRSSTFTAAHFGILKPACQTNRLFVRFYLPWILNPSTSLALLGCNAFFTGYDIPHYLAENNDLSRRVNVLRTQVAGNLICSFTIGLIPSSASVIHNWWQAAFLAAWQPGLQPA